MTDVLSSVRVGARAGEDHADKDGNQPCRASGGHASLYAYRRGCRSRQARELKAARSAWEQTRDAVVNPHCKAEEHGGGLVAYRQGCTCLRAAHSREGYRRREQEARLRAQRAAEHNAVTDPREPWRRPSMLVDRWALEMLLHGAPCRSMADGSVTNSEAELMVAMLYLTGRRTRGGAPYNRRDIAALLGITPERVERLRDTHRRRRNRRTARRLAEATWRAQRNERLTGDPRGVVR